MPNLATCLLLPDRGPEAARYYGALFGAEVTDVTGPTGNVLLSTMVIAGQDLVIINATGVESDVRSQRVSLQIHVDGQAEFDRFWEALTDGGEPSQNGWLIDRFGVWWDIVPIQQMELFRTASPEAVARMGAALGRMQRIDLAELERLAAGE